MRTTSKNTDLFFVLIKKIKAFLLPPWPSYLNFSLLSFLAINNKLQLFKVQEQLVKEWNMSKKGRSTGKHKGRERKKPYCLLTVNSLHFPLNNSSFVVCFFQVKSVLDEIIEKLPEPFNMAEIMAKAENKTPYVVVAFQECERMNILTHEIRRSLKELDLGLKVCTGVKAPFPTQQFPVICK